jgi:hypothetical protein
MAICSATEAMPRRIWFEPGRRRRSARAIQLLPARIGWGGDGGALDLEPGDIDPSHSSDLSEEFGKLGLKRERQLYALKRKNRLQAVVMVNIADIGLNLSDLTNAITLFVLDQRELTNGMVCEALSDLMKSLGQEQLPVLIYPEAAAESLKIPIEKRYVMWSLMPHFSDGFHRYTNSILRAGRRNGGIHDKRRSPPV